MSCPDWRRLVAERDANGGEAPPRAGAPLRAGAIGWDAAGEHFDACPRCREEALAADPTLVFRRLAAPVAADVAAMKQGVAAMIRASRVSPPASAARAFEPRPAHAFRQGRFRQRPVWPGLGGWAKPAAAAALLAVLVLQAPIASRAPRAGGDAPAALPAATGPILEDLDLPDARVYEVASEEMQVAMIVDPSLDL